MPDAAGPADPVDVVVVGAGPTGLTAAHLCRRLGLSCVVVERRDGPLRAPAAHAVNARTFEIWRHAGLDVDGLRALALDPAEAGAVHWVTALGGDCLGSLPYERQGPEMLALTPTPLRNLSQHRLEPALAHGVDVRWRTTCLAVREPSAADVPAASAASVGPEGPDGPGAVVEVDVDGPDGRATLRARHVLAADGAGSGIRKAMGIDMEGPRTLQTFLMLHLAADFRSLTAGRPGVLHFVVDPRSSGTFVSHGVDREWVYMHPWPEADPVPAPDDPVCASLVRAALADPTVAFTVVGTSVWHMSAQVAAGYGTRRVHLVGDAAHRFPPTGGLGLNTGVADVHDLLWKVAGVLHGRLHPAWLDTYGTERRPVALHNCAQSLTNAFRLVEVAGAIGLGPDPAASVAALEATLADPARRAAVAAAVAAQATHFDLLGLQLGHRYEGAGVLGGAEPGDPVAADPVRDYVPSTAPGGRLPHAPLADGGSTLDLVDPVVPTVLVPDGADLPDVHPAAVVVRRVPATAWAAMGADDRALVVRPDQHVFARVTVAAVPEVVAGFRTAPAGSPDP